MNRVGQPIGGISRNPESIAQVPSITNRWDTTITSELREVEPTSHCGLSSGLSLFSQYSVLLRLLRKTFSFFLAGQPILM
jgi:hypothetical protein